MSIKHFTTQLLELLLFKRKHAFTTQLLEPLCARAHGGCHLAVFSLLIEEFGIGVEHVRVLRACFDRLLQQQVRAINVSSLWICMCVCVYVCVYVYIHT